MSFIELVDKDFNLLNYNDLSKRKIILMGQILNTNTF